MSVKITVDSDVPFPEKSGREVSTIAFPYFGLDDAINVARAMHEVGGGVPMSRDQVGSALDSAGGSLANKLSAAKQFGLIDSAQGKWTLTPLGYEILDSGRERAAKAEAFLRVELYKRAYDEFRSKPLPGKGGLEHAFTTFGVAHKQKEKARQAFERSARSAGFFPNGSEGRLVMPIIGGATIVAPMEAPEEEVQAPQPTPRPQHAAAYDIGYREQLDPFIRGLLDRLPASLPLPDKAEWTVAERAKWLQAAAQIFDLLYEGSGEIVVTVKKSDL